MMRAGSVLRQMVLARNPHPCAPIMQQLLHHDLVASNRQARCYNTESAIELDPVKAIGYKLPEWMFNYTSQNVILYALGVGVSTNQPDCLKFLFENNDEFCVLPSYGIVTAQREVLASTLEGRLPGLSKIDPAKVLHGEQYLEVHSPIPRSASLRNECVIVDVLDKRSGAVLLFDVHTYDGDTLVTYNQFSFFIVGAGGFGGKKDSDHVKPTEKLPSSSPEFTVRQTTSHDQAALYRLSGDDNPLHIDPDVAARAGFPRPILHGLCTLGFGVRHVLSKYANNDVTKLKRIKVRFSKPVFPGQTIQTDMMRHGQRAFFRCKVAETDDIVISGAYIDFELP